jgi:hypothetical protein
MQKPERDKTECGVESVDCGEDNARPRDYRPRELRPIKIDFQEEMKCERDFNFFRKRKMNTPDTGYA